MGWQSEVVFFFFFAPSEHSQRIVSSESVAGLGLGSGRYTRLEYFAQIERILRGWLRVRTAVGSFLESRMTR